MQKYTITLEIFWRNFQVERQRRKKSFSSLLHSIQVIRGHTMPYTIYRQVRRSLKKLKQLLSKWSKDFQKTGSLLPAKQIIIANKRTWRERKILLKSQFS